MSRILLTGFEPFGGDAGNPSGDAVRALDVQWSGPDELVTAVLPVTFGEAAATLRELVTRHQPDVVIATGLAGGRTEISIERVAINLRDARIPDNAGAQPVDAPCVPNAPAAVFATVPVKAMARQVAEAGVPAAVSYSAGTFVCNDVFFAAVVAAPRAGFIHVPWSEQTVPGDAFALPLEQIVAALDIAVRVAAAVTADDATPAGKLH